LDGAGFSVRIVSLHSYINMEEERRVRRGESRVGEVAREGGVNERHDESHELAC
jgi:hypothetical protein